MSRYTKFNVLLVTDSRGRGIKNLLDLSLATNLPTAKVTIHHILRPGATLHKFTKEIIQTCNTSTPDIILIIGGLCSITSKATYGRYTCINYSDSQSKVEHITSTIDDLGSIPPTFTSYQLVNGKNLFTGKTQSM